MSLLPGCITRNSRQTRSASMFLSADGETAVCMFFNSSMQVDQHSPRRASPQPLACEHFKKVHRLAHRSTERNPVERLCRIPARSMSTSHESYDHLSYLRRSTAV